MSGASPGNPGIGRGGLLFSGEHWLNYLRLPGSGRDSAMVSIYRGRFSPAGPGTAAYVRIEGEAGFQAACTDSPAFEQFIRTTMYRNGPFADFPVVAAEFRQEGDVRDRPAWRISAGDREIRAVWSGLAAPHVGPPTLHPKIVFTILVFASAGSVELDGRQIPGEPYMREGWTKNLGRPHSSVCFALAETMIA